MDSLDVIKVCLRRWYVFLPLVLLAAGAGVGLSKQVKSTWSATGSYAFLYPRPEAITPSSDPRNQNPLVLGGNTALLGEAVQANLSSAAVQDELGRHNRGWAPDEPATATHYTVTLPPQSASFVVQTWADTQEDAAKVVQDVLKATTRSAQEAQERAGAPEPSRYTAFVTAATQTEELPPQSPVKLLITMVALGAVAGAALSLLVERLPKRSRRRKSRSTLRARPTPRPRPSAATLAGPSKPTTTDQPDATPGRDSDTPVEASAAQRQPVTP